MNGWTSMRDCVQRLRVVSTWTGLLLVAVSAFSTAQADAGARKDLPAAAATGQSSSKSTSQGASQPDQKATLTSPNGQEETASKKSSTSAKSLALELAPKYLIFPEVVVGSASAVQA